MKLLDPGRTETENRKYGERMRSDKTCQTKQYTGTDNVSGVSYVTNFCTGTVN